MIHYIILLSSLYLLNAPATHATKVRKPQAQKEFFSFMTTLYKWGSFVKNKQNSDEKITDIYFRLKKEQVQKFGQFLEKNRSALHNLTKYNDLNKIGKKEIIPKEIYKFVSKNFGIRDLDIKLDPNIFILKLIGGHFHFKHNKNFKIEGFLEKVESFSLSTWDPVVHFINSFRDTLTLDSHLSEKLGQTMLPLIEKYYNYLDTVSKIKILQAVAEDWHSYEFKGDREHDNNKLALKVFQTSGPIIIKLLQEMQEEVVGETPVSEVLRSLSQSKPMNKDIVKEITKNELLKLTCKKKLREFKFQNKPLGIASIAQTHLFSLNGKKFVVKVQRQKIDDIFAREKESIARLIKTEDTFDRGMKRKINNANEGIEEELNFNFERNNIELGKILYQDPNLKINTVAIPRKIFSKKMAISNSKVLFMTLAEGESLGKILERSNPDELFISYHIMQNLYKKFLSVALDASYPKNFYHGDLHRENIFIDLDKKQTTIIDFGNAGKISHNMKKHILNIYKNSRKTQTKDEKNLDTAIINLSRSLEALILEYEIKNGGDHPLRNSLVKTFFRKCFNPNTGINDKILENKKLQDIITRLEEKKIKLDKMSSDYNNNNLLIQEDLDLIKAFRNHCFNGPVNRILSTLGGENMVSEKLRIIFDELQKNGLAMPKEIIFFNKSNNLLHGILNNISEILYKTETPYQHVEPDSIFDSMIKSIAKEGE